MKKKRFGRIGLMWELSKGSRFLYIASVIMTAISILASYFVPQIIRFVADCVVGDEPMTLPLFVREFLDSVGGVEYLREHMLLVGAFTLLVAAIGSVAGYLRGRWTAISSEGVIKRLRDRLYAHIQSLPYSWHVKIQTGDIIQRCTSDVDVVRNFIANQLSEMIRTILLVTFAYAILFSMNVPMALASFLYLPVVFIYSIAFLFKISHRFLIADEAEGQLLSVAQENLTGVRVVRAFGRERYEIDRFEESNSGFAKLWEKLGGLLSWYWSASDLLTALQFFTICVVGTYQAIAGNLTVGDFIVFITYNAMTIWPVRNLGRILAEASKTGVSLGRLKEILDSQPETDSPDAIEPAEFGDIVFEHVSFAYEDTPVLEDVSFTVKKGETLGILGGTGSGKTTIVHLICRLYDLAEGCGKITVGGVDINRIKRSWLRANIGIVLQEPFLYSRTIKENIAALSETHSLHEVQNAATVSHVHESIRQFPQGYDTIVGERGVTLSGGQKQRVAIARAVIKNPPVMIFDDSLSAVDTETDQNIRSALAERDSKSTTIIIAHRITSLSRADKIIVVDQGRIAETGTHAQLLASGGIYSRVYNLQGNLEEVQE